MRLIFIFFLLISSGAMAQWKDYIIGVNGDTLNCVDRDGLKQGRWVHRYETLRGEPGFEEQGVYTDGKKTGSWKIFSLMGDLIGVEEYKWGNKDGTCLYYNQQGELLREESWKAFNPEREMDTLMVEDVDNPGNYIKKVIKHEGAAVKHGEWRIYQPGSGILVKKEVYFLGELQSATKGQMISAEKKEVLKPKEVLEYEKKNEGKKKVKTRTGSTGF